MKTKLHHQFIRTNGINLHVVEAGNPHGLPIMLLHGFPEFWYGWHRQIDFFADQGHRLIMPDQRGYNLSDKPSGILSYQIKYLVDDIIGIIDYMGIDQIVLIGHDWGGIIAWYLAMIHPHRLKKLINLNIPHPYIMKQFLLKSWEQRKKSWYILFFQLPFLPEFLLSVRNYRNFKKVLTVTSRRDTFPEETISHYVNAWKHPGAITAMINWYRATFRNLGSSTGPVRVQVPTLIVWGKHDPYLSYEMAPRSAELCADGHLETFEEATHWVLHDEAEAVSRLMIDHFSPAMQPVPGD